MPDKATPRDAALDRYDVAILAELQRDARLSNAELARVPVASDDRVGPAPHFKPIGAFQAAWVQKAPIACALSWANRGVGAEAVDLEARAADERDRDSRTLVGTARRLGDRRRGLAVNLRAV